MDGKDKNLIMFFSWRRLELVEKSFVNLLESVRPQDKLLVLDYEGANSSFFLRHKDKIDYLFFPKFNSDKGLTWHFLRQFLNWLDKINIIFDRHDNIKWYPDFINIVESDTLGATGWIDRIIEVFNNDEKIGIATGYDANEWETKNKQREILIKETTPGVQMMFKTEHFKQLMDGLNTTLGCRRHDWIVSQKNLSMGFNVGVLPGEIIHIG